MALPEVSIKTKSKKVNEPHATCVVIVLNNTKADPHGGEHPDWKSDVSKWDVKEPREMPRAKLKVKVEKSGNDVELKWKQEWSLDTTKYMEVYGVLRAEWYFGKKKGMNKLATKVNGNHGIDSLFVKGNQYHIVESKCSTDTAKYAKYLALKAPADPHSSERKYDATERLGDIVRHIPVALAKKWQGRDLAKFLGEIEDWKGRKYKKCITLCFTQMTESWMQAKIREMLKAAPDVKTNGKNLRDAIKEKRASRWFNFYATDPFYRLPGKYDIYAARKAEFMASGDTKGKYIKAKPRDFDWPDGKGEAKEFILLDKDKEFVKMEKTEKKDAVDDISNAW
jgi:hypothetical protein